MPRHTADTQHSPPKSPNPGWIGILILIFILAIPDQQAGAQQTASRDGHIEIEPSAALWLEGSASIVDYRCYARSLEGAGIIQNIAQPTQNIQGHGDVHIKVTVPVKALECGKKKMNRDMYEALKADEHPRISYRLLEADLLNRSSNPDSTGWMKIKTVGLLTIAGVTDTTELVVDGQVVGRDRFRVKGTKPLNMHTFDIKPPTALFGLIKADERLTVHFDVSVLLKD